MSDFMEVFTVTHLTFLLLFPFFLSVIGLLLVFSNNAFSLHVDSLPAIVLGMLMCLLVMDKVWKTCKEAPYFKARMEQIDGGDRKLR